MLHHVTGDGEHWDLMLEAGDVLATWRLATPPSASTGTIDAHHIGDHRKAYLDYEGPISGDRGHVRRIDRGTYFTVERSADRWIIEMNGSLCYGRYLLSRKPNTPAGSWSFGAHSASAADRGMA